MKSSLLKSAGTWSNLAPMHPEEEASGGMMPSLGEESHDPRTDKDWVNPWAQKGTEFNNPRMQASVEIHETPKMLPPREDLRSHLDEDLKKEMKEDGKVGFVSKLLKKRT